MKKIYITVTLAITIIIVLIVLFFQKVKEGQIGYQKDLLQSQVQKCGDYVERTITNYESDLNRIIFKHINDIHNIFNDEETMYYIGRDLEGFYAKYRDLVNSIYVYDNNNNFLGIYINEHDDFVVDTFARQSENELEPRDVIKVNNSDYESFFPYFKDGVLKGNIVVQIDLQKYLENIFELYKIDNLVYQWVLNDEGKIIFSNFDQDTDVNALSRLTDSVSANFAGSIEHNIVFDNRPLHTISSYYPLSVINSDLGIIFSMNSAHLLDVFFNRYLILSIVLILIFLFLVGYLFFILYKRQNSKGDLQSNLIRLKMIIEHFPIGIMVQDKHGLIKMINQTGQRMLFIDKNEDLTGKKFDDQFLISNNYLLDEGIPGNMEDNHLIHYVRDGNDIVIYRKDEIKQVQGEELTISALMDVSPIEKSRKKEAAANQAKSDFLAKMSHEIRTPMNGIIGMTESLLLDGLDKDAGEKVKVINNSAELLLNLINDILDFSKIEAGKMMLEEIPFTLSEEIKITRELFKPLVEEKNLEFIANISSGVPDKLIGDPFRIRQVISNLLSNSIKFTGEGKIVLTIDTLERINNGIRLLISVEDTGIGISKDKIDTIFGSYGQAAGATSRKFGGTGLGMAISRQLVELMNGEIWIESPAAGKKKEKNQGTKVSFTVELYSDEKLKKNYDYSGIRKFSQVTALILSKKKDESDQIHRILDSFGVNYKYRLYDDKTIDSVIYHIEQKADLYQMIIILDKPEHEGFGMALQLKENDISSRFLIIMSSTNEKPGNYLKCRNLEVDYYLIQPYESHEIFNIFHQSFPSIEDTGGILDQINKIRSNLKILIAEDNIINQRVVQSLFKHLGHEVEIANNGDEAVKMLNDNNFDVVFMDIIMPVMDGLTATKMIREAGNDITIVAMTGSEESEKRDEAFSAGMNDYLTKPVKVKDIKHLLIKWFSESLEFKE